MFILIVFSFIAGIVTILSPCILPVLPIILSSTIGGKDTSRSRPLGIITGFIASFTFFTLFLSSIVQLSGIPTDSLRTLSIIIIALFGLSLLLPSFQVLVEKLFSRLSNLIPRSNTKSGFIPGILVGLSLGLLWTPCVGPILASVISLAITGTVTFDAFIITLAYSIGTSIPMLIIMLGGQNILKWVPGLLSNTALIQKIFGVIMILTAIAIYLNIDRKFQTFILTTFPSYGTGLTNIENITPVKNALNTLLGREVDEADMGKPLFNLMMKGKKAPEIIPGGSWINLPAGGPLTIAGLKGKVVLIDFWTYSCINCQRTFPYLKNWHKKYQDKGLVIIGVHSPEFEFEKDLKNVKEAAKDFGLSYPIVQDNDFATWFAYENHYWPAKYIIDKDGYIRYSHFGEGAYDETEKVIQELLIETGAKNAKQEIDNPAYQNYGSTPEKYLGYWRIDKFVSPEGVIKDQLTSFTRPKTISSSELAYEGKWLIAEKHAAPMSGSKLHLNFNAKEVFLVMRPKTDGTESRVKVFVDEKLQYFGEDNKNGIVTVTKDTLYKLINLPVAGQHILKLEFSDDNMEVYAFTFG